jgi:hypothetical protein
MAASSSTRGAMTTPSSSSVVESAGIEPGTRPPTSAWWARAGGEAEQLAVVEGRRDDRDVGQVRAAGVGVVEHPRDALAWSRSRTAADRAGMAPRCTGMCSACMTISPAASKRAVRAVAALLDVRAVGRAHEHGAHLLARGAQGAGR